MAKQIAVVTSSANPEAFRKYMRPRTIFAGQLPRDAPNAEEGQIVHFMDKANENIIASGRVVEWRFGGSFNAEVTEFYT